MTEDIDLLFLKLTRLSETDLSDCRVLLAHAAREPVDEPRVLEALRALPATGDQALMERRAALARLVKAAT